MPSRRRALLHERVRRGARRTHSDPAASPKTILLRLEYDRLSCLDDTRTDRCSSATCCTAPAHHAERTIADPLSLEKSACCGSATRPPEMALYSVIRSAIASNRCSDLLGPRLVAEHGRGCYTSYGGRSGARQYTRRNVLVPARLFMTTTVSDYL